MTEQDANWQTLLGIGWPDPATAESLCDQSGECCRGAAQTAPWRNLLVQAVRGDNTARTFLSQFVPYASLEEARRHAPDAVSASLEIAAERGDDSGTVVFYRCRYLEGKNTCTIYEDRPALCREFPESPFGSVPACCGYARRAGECRDKLSALRDELARLKSLQRHLRPGSSD